VRRLAFSPGFPRAGGTRTARQPKTSIKMAAVELREGIDLRVGQGDDPRLQVIVDIDDTVKSSGGVRLAGIPIGGIDTQYKRGSFYPGVFRFLLGMAKHGLVEADDDGSPAQEPLKVAVLTARAEELKWALQLKDTDPICRSFTEQGRAEGYGAWGVGNVMYGSVREWVVQDLKGWRKYENFKIMRQLYRREPRAYVFVGDTGKPWEVHRNHSPHASVCARCLCAAPLCMRSLWEALRGVHAEALACGLTAAAHTLRCIPQASWTRSAACAC